MYSSNSKIYKFKKLLPSQRPCAPSDRRARPATRSTGCYRYCSGPPETIEVRTLLYAGTTPGTFGRRWFF